MDSFRRMVETVDEKRSRSLEGSEKQPSCFWFGLCVSCCASLAQKQTPRCRYVPPVPSALGLMCVPANPPFTSSTLSDTSHLFPLLKHRQRTHSLHGLENWTRRLDSKRVCVLFIYFLVACHLSVNWPQIHFLYEVTSSQEASITQEKWSGHAQETVRVHASAFRSFPVPRSEYWLLALF